MKGKMAPDSALKRSGDHPKDRWHDCLFDVALIGQAVRQLDFRGLVVLFDEAEQVPSLNTRNRSSC